MQAEARRPVAASPQKTSQPADTEVLLVNVGSRTFAIPLEHVRYVAPMPTDFATANGNTEEYFVFEGEPLSYVSLWNTLGLQSSYLEYQEMQSTLPQREQDHIDWMNALEVSIRNDTPFAKARSPYECAFGKWFYNYQPKDRRLALVLGQFERPHALIHGLADKLLGLSHNGQSQEALQLFEEAKSTTLTTLLQLFESAQALVIDLQRRVAIIVDDAEESCALGADGVKDIVLIPAERIRPNTHGDTHATSALIILDDQSVVPLLNWRIFNTGGKEEKTA